MLGLSLTALAALAGGYWIVWRLSPGPVPEVPDGDETDTDALQSGQTEQDADAMQSATRRRDYRDTSSPRVGPSAALARTRPMVRRTTEGTGEAAYQRLARRTEEAQAAANERTEALFDNVIAEIRAMRQDVQKIDIKQTGFEGRLGELEVQVNMTRDEVQKRALNPAPSQIASAKTAIKDAAKSPWGKLVIGATGFVAIVSALNNIPDAVRASERFWHFLAGRDLKAYEVVVPPKAVVPAK